MSEKEYPRVLVLSNLCFSETSNNGRTLGNFFKGWPHDKLAQFYIKEDKTWNEVCEKYYCFTDEQVLNLFFHWKAKKRRTSDTINQTVSTSSMIVKNVLARIIRTLLWKLTPWKNEGFNQFVDDFKPEAILLQAGDTIFMYDLARELTSRYAVPLFLYNSEDCALQRKNYFYNSIWGNMVYPIFHSWLKKSFWETIKCTKSVIYISDKLQDTYNRIKKHDSHVIYTSTALPTFEKHPENTPLIVSYFGNLVFDRDNALIELSKAFAEIDSQIKIHVYGKYPTAIQQKLEASGVVKLKGFVQYGELKKIIDSSDAVVHIESFSDYYANFNDHFFTTKIADCLKCGRPFLVYAPSKIAFVQYLKNNDAAIVVSSREMLKETVKRFVKDSEYRNSKIANAIKLADRNHNIEKNRQKFQEILFH